MEHLMDFIMDRIWDLFVDAMAATFMPLVCFYYLLSGSVFLNVSAEKPTLLEGIGNKLLSPTQYLLAGKQAIQQSDGSWKFVQKFDYNDGLFWIKSASSLFALPPTLLLGSAIKGISLLDKEGSKHYTSLVAARNSKETHSQIDRYEAMGMELNAPDVEWLTPLGCLRRAEDKNKMQVEKRALYEIGDILNQAGIPWWVDCGTCLGAYRYGGSIPWDWDIDIAVLLPDFQNVLHALNRLDPNQYMVQDWSSRDHPDSFIKVYLKETGTLIDIYHFAIDPEKKELSYIFSLETNMFFPEWFKIRERRFKAPVSFNTVFPLKKALFDGVEVFVPNDTKTYLQRYYGENLNPAKIYDPVTANYEKDLSHPYWQRAYAK